MGTEQVFVVMIAVTVALVAGIVGLIVKVRRGERRQMAFSRYVIARMYAGEVAYHPEPAALRVCESCRQVPASVRVAVTGRPPFAVCSGCVPDDVLPGVQVRPLTASAENWGGVAS